MFEFETLSDFYEYDSTLLLDDGCYCYGILVLKGWWGDESA